MLKKLTLFTAVFAMLVLLASPAHAMLRLLDQEISDELKAIAKEHIASSENIGADAITIDDAWLREFFNLKVDVYMIEATIDQGLSTERKIQIPVRVDTKAILSEADFALLVEEDSALAPDEPVMRIMTATDTAVTDEQPNSQTPEDAQDKLAAEATLEEDSAATQTGGNTVLLIGASVLAVAALIVGLKVVRRKATTK